MSYGGGEFGWLCKSKDYEIVLSTTVTELYSFMKCLGSCQFLRELWTDLSGEVANIHMRTACEERRNYRKNDSPP